MATQELPNPEARASTALDLIHRGLPADVFPCTQGMIIGKESKYVRWTFPDELETVEILQITDVQFGHVFCRADRVVEYRDWILARPNRFMVWTGDMVDAYRIGGMGLPWDQLGDPQSQLVGLINLWGPARHRILGFVGGNHERRPSEAFGDLGMLIAALLRIPYSSGRQFLDIRFGRHAPFKISLWHGMGGARTKGTVAQILDRFMQQGDSQLYLMGHLHQPLIMPLWKQVRNEKKQIVELRKSIGAVGSSFLETFGSYGERAGMAPGDVLMPRAVLYRDGGWEVTLR